MHILRSCAPIGMADKGGASDFRPALPLLSCWRRGAAASAGAARITPRIRPSLSRCNSLTLAATPPPPALPRAPAGLAAKVEVRLAVRSVAKSSAQYFLAVRARARHAAAAPPLLLPSQPPRRRLPAAAAATHPRAAAHPPAQAFRHYDDKWEEVARTEPADVCVPQPASVAARCALPLRSRAPRRTRRARSAPAAPLHLAAPAHIAIAAARVTPTTRGRSG